MIFKFNDFIIQVESKITETNEKVIAPIGLEKYSSKPIMGWKYRTREITIFDSLAFKNKGDKKYYAVISDIFVFIELIEILKAFNGNKLNISKEYNISGKFTAKTTQKDSEIFLKIHFKNYSNSLFLDKFECSSLAAKFTKILNRCEAWQEQEA